MFSMIDQLSDIQNAFKLIKVWGKHSQNSVLSHVQARVVALKGFFPKIKNTARCYRLMFREERLIKNVSWILFSETVTRNSKENKRKISSNYVQKSKRIICDSGSNTVLQISISTTRVTTRDIPAVVNITFPYESYL